MALTEFQRSVCRLIARSTVASGESYVAGGAALNEVLANAYRGFVASGYDLRELVRGLMTSTAFSKRR